MTATLTLDAIPHPLRVDAEGVVRVGKTRVTLDSVLEAFQEGMTPEEIVRQFPTLQIAGIYAAISFYLHNRERVDAYLEERERQAGAIRREIEAGSSQHGLRERLLARRSRHEGERNQPASETLESE